MFNGLYIAIIYSGTAQNLISVLLSDSIDLGVDGGDFRTPTAEKGRTVSYKVIAKPYDIHIYQYLISA